MGHTTELAGHITKAATTPSWPKPEGNAARATAKTVRLFHRWRRRGQAARRCGSDPDAGIATTVTGSVGRIRSCQPKKCGATPPDPWSRSRTEPNCSSISTWPGLERDRRPPSVLWGLLGEVGMCDSPGLWRLRPLLGESPELGEWIECGFLVQRAVWGWRGVSMSSMCSGSPLTSTLPFSICTLILVPASGMPSTRSGPISSGIIGASQALP